MEDSEWIEMQRTERMQIMTELELLAEEVKKINRYVGKQPLIDVGYQRKIVVMQNNWKILLMVVDKKLQNLANKSELEYALDKIKQEVRDIAEESNTKRTIKANPNGNR